MRRFWRITSNKLGLALALASIATTLVQMGLPAVGFVLSPGQGYVLLALAFVFGVGSLFALFWPSRQNLELETQERRRAEDAYQEYEREMGQWIADPNKPLLDSPPEDPRRRLAWQKTCTLLKRLDSSRKRDVLEFLSMQGLIVAYNLNAIVTLNGADFSEAHLAGIKLSNAHLVQVNFKDADLSDAELCDFTIVPEAMAEAQRMNVLPGNFAHPTGSNLTDTKLNGAILKKAVLAGCEFSFANFEGANLDRADLRGADLQEARNLTQEQVNQAYGSLGHVLIEDTQLPKGIDPPASWSNLVYEQKRERGEL